MNPHNFRHHQERFNRASHSDALREMQIPDDDYVPMQPATFRSVVVEIRAGEFAIFAVAIVLPLLALAAALPA